MESIKKKQWRHCLTLLVLNLFIILVVLHSFEFILSRTHPGAKLPYNGVINGTQYTWGHEVVKNSYGFREREFVTPKPPGTVRIMVLGDSLTFGVGLRAEERYSRLLEDLMNNAFPSLRYEVLNFGRNGFSTLEERDVLREYINKVEPDLLIVGFCLNDTQPRSQVYSIERARFNKRQGKVIKKIYRFLNVLGLDYTADLFKDASYRFAERRGHFPSWQVALDRTYEEGSKEWKDFVTALEDIRSMSNRMGLPAPIFVTLNQGTYTDKSTDYANPDEALETYLRWYHQVERTAFNSGFHVTNHENELKNMKAEPLSVNILDAHPSPNLNRVYAEKLFKAIRNQSPALTGAR
jgi:lysophospholipase L1-like esterase